MKLSALVFAVFLFPFFTQARDAETGSTVGEKLPPPPTKVLITLEASDEKTLTIRVSNGTGKPFSYSGYSPESPIYSIKEHPIGWCGTGVRGHTLNPGRSFTFKIGRGMIRDPKTKEIHVTLGDATSAAISVK